MKRDEEDFMLLLLSCTGSVGSQTAGNTNSSGEALAPICTPPSEE